MRSWLWLLAGAALLPFTVLQTTIPLAAWVAPVLLLMAAGVRAGPRSAAERAELRRQYFTPALDDLLDRTVTAARSGARIVTWSEAAAYDFVEEGAAVVERARAVARAERIYLQIGVVYLLSSKPSPNVEIRAIMIDPDGTVVWNYLKTSTVLNDGNVPGPGMVPTMDTPYGRWVGDAVAWLCLTGLLAMAAAATVRRFRRTAGVPELRPGRRTEHESRADRTARYGRANLGLPGKRILLRYRRPTSQDQR